MKPTLLKSPSFVVEDHRTGKDFQDSCFSLLQQVFTDHQDLWEELIETIRAEWKIAPVTFKLYGYRKSFMAKAQLAKCYIKVTSHASPLSRIDTNEDKMALIIATIIHELGHLVTPIGYNLYSSQRNIHGQAFKKNVYTIAQWANAIGLLPNKLVIYGLGNANIGKAMQVLESPSETIFAANGTSTPVRIGDTIEWQHSGTKWGGTWTGKVHNKTSNNLKVSNCMQNGKPSTGTWTIPLMSSYKVIA